jgi:sterol desaturase/sphingolipid hydroxylase (fatty acid hydroxylase superfamily)
MHKVHHSRWQPETDSNYSSLFSFWDRIGRTFRLREDPSTLEFGLDGWDAPEDQRFAGLLWAPLKRVDSDEDLRSKAVSVESASRDGNSARTE